ncbi:hypothetical protein J6590_005693 [Homalodisca vitripennis]|nr:hypothetical protein J6590_005693 [Homalodisca vitripennis]
MNCGTKRQDEMHRAAPTAASPPHHLKAASPRRIDFNATKQHVRNTLYPVQLKVEITGGFSRRDHTLHHCAIMDRSVVSLITDTVLSETLGGPAKLPPPPASHRSHTILRLMAPSWQCVVNILLDNDLTFSDHVMPHNLCVVVKVLNILLDNDLTFSDHVIPHNLVQALTDRDCVVVKVLCILLNNDLTFSDHVIPHNLEQALTDRDVRIALNGTFLAVCG